MKPFLSQPWSAGIGRRWREKRLTRYVQVGLNPRSRRTLLWVVLVSWASAIPLFGFSVLSSNQLVFVNLDHAPMGVCSTMTYGYKGAICGIGTSTGGYPYIGGTPGGGVLVALSGSAGLQILPFVGSTTSISSAATFFPDAAIQRNVTPCTDEFTVSGSGLEFTHYSPVWFMPKLNSATPQEQKRFFLPATWLVFNLTNSTSAPEDFYFGLPAPLVQKTYANGAYQGFAQGEAALAAQSGTCDLLTGSQLSSVFNGMTSGGAFHVSIPAGQTRTLMVVIAYYRTAVVDSRLGSHYYYTSLFPSIDSVIDAAFAGFGDAQARCRQLADVMSAAGLNPFRHFMACEALRSFVADSACLLDPQGGVHWWEMEGYFNYINTFDLTVDHAFYDSIMEPWALRNVLDSYSGALGAGYNYHAPLYNASTYAQVSSHGFSFDHDMGMWPNSSTGPAYGANMGLEELQSWILSAGLYWSHSGDHAWLTNNGTLLQTCLNSLLLRDSTNSAARDGVPKNINSGEISTFDNLDASLQTSAFSGRLAVRNWACYVVLNAMFGQIGDTADAATCASMASTTAQTIVDRWNSYKGTLGYIPARLDGSATAAITPMVEGLAYPAAMGLTNAVDRVSGPYASMLQALSNHMAAVLMPGRCISASSGGWVMTTGSLINWPSKIFIDQYATEAVLGITNDLVNGSVDQVHATIQIQTGTKDGWLDALDGTGGYRFAGAAHYPRAATSALWWLNVNNNPPNPLAPPTVTPLAQTAEAGATPSFRARAEGYPAQPYRWFFNGTQPVVSGATDGTLRLTNVQPAQAGVYTLVLTNDAGNATSAPVVLNVIPPVPRRLVPALALGAHAGNPLTLEFADSVSAPYNWLPLSTLDPSSTWFYDQTMPLPAMRFYRAGQPASAGGPPSLNVYLAPALRLSGAIGSSVRLDYINQVGPTNAWNPIATLTLTNTVQEYVDTSAIGQPPRLWRTVALP